MNLLGHLLFGFVWWILLLPLFLLFASPFLLILSVGGDRPYLHNVRNRYSRVVEFWRENAWALSP